LDRLSRIDGKCCFIAAIIARDDLALDEAVKSGRIKKGDTFVIVGFGAGLTWASAVIKWCKED
jgi:3-oxoacyl-[acyl-carrier-protein] synthase III